MYGIVLVFLTLLGLCFGSFSNVLIYRIPKGEEFVKTPSHCMTCGHTLKWYENIPLFSWLVQKGKCRHCGTSLSAQYPIVEALNGLMWLLAGLMFRHDPLKAVLYCCLFSLLVVIAFIDWRTFQIPNGLNLAILILGVVRLITDLSNWHNYVIGMCCVSLLFFLIWLLTGGNGVGLGDIKLMGAAGLLVGWQNIVFSMFAGCIFGSIIHLWRMKHGAGKKLAFGPYLAAGIWFAAMFGEQLIGWYLGLFGF